MFHYVPLIGHRRDGRPIYLVQGGDHTAAGGDGETPPSSQGGETPPEVDWKARAEKAEADTEKWRSHSRTQEQRAKDNADKAKKWDEQEAANATELEKTQERADRAEATVKAANERAVRAEVKALAADGWADPSDAALYLGELTGYLADDGEIKTNDISSDLAKVLEAKPHLAKPAEAERDVQSRVPKPDPSQGGRPHQPEPLDKRVRSRIEQIRADTGIG